MLRVPNNCIISCTNSYSVCLIKSASYCLAIQWGCRILNASAAICDQIYCKWLYLMVVFLYSSAFFEVSAVECSPVMVPKLFCGI